MENDLDVDCCPLDDNDKQRLASVKFDSGYKSGVDSLTLKSDISEGRLASNVDSLIPLRNDSIEKGVESLTLHQDEDKTRLESTDEGYDSRLKSEDFESVHKSATKDECNIESEQRQAQFEAAFTQDVDGDTQLHSSIIHLLEDMSLFFISLVPEWCFLNIRNNYLQTPLHLTVITKQPSLTRKLMTAGASVDVRDHKGNTPLHIAAKEGDAISAQLLLEPVKYEETEDLSYTIPYQKIPQNLEARNYDGQVCVHLAAEGSHIDVLNVLLAKGANINARDGKSGRTILHYAAESGNVRLLRFLLTQRNLDINAITYAGLTPIMLAYGRNNNEVVKILREHGADFDSDDSGSGEEEMEDDSYDDIRINGRPVTNHHA